jgi:hypothetical protein
MRNLITREAAVAMAGEELVNNAEQTNCDNACFVTDGTEWAGYDAYTATADNDEYRVTVYFLQDAEETKNMPLDEMTWDIEGYEVEEV